MDSSCIGVLGAFFRGGQQFLSAKTQSCSDKKYPLRGGQILQLCSAKLMYYSFVSHCSASLNIGQKLLNDDSKTGKNGRKIGKYLAETKQKWKKTNKNGWNQTKLAEKFIIYGGKGECWSCSVSALLSFPILFCQAVYFFSSKPPIFVLPKLNIFARGGQGPPGPPPQERLWGHGHTLDFCTVDKPHS